MRVLFTTLPGAGAFHALVPLARALEAAGHEVAFATSRSYCPTVEGTGFRCFPAGYDWLVGEREPLYARVRESLAGRDAPFSPLEDVYTAFLPPRMVPGLVDLGRSWGPEALVREPMEFAGCVAAEVLGIPHAACGPFFSFWQGAWHGVPGEVGKPKLEALRRAYGLPPDPDLVMLHRYLYLAFLPPAFLHPDLTPPSTVHFLRPVSFNRSGAEVSPPWLARLPERPTVHASLGTVFHRTPGVFSAILEGLRDEEINLILAVGRDQDPAAFGPQPPNVYIERYIPHTVLLPHCDAVITHGGFSSVMACIEEGLPMVAVPLAGGDQAGNAQRCAALGVARVVAPDQRTPETIREAVLDVLRDPRYRENAGHLRREIQTLPEPEHAVELLERLVLEKTPLAKTPQRAAVRGDVS
ncbi:MAG: glycosyltransferase [Actinomycetota bacterium]|nr:glycosyltransferase [Actinomycetota bacterium]